MILVQIAFVVLWITTYQPALFSLRVLFFRTVAVLGFGWFTTVNRAHMEPGLMLFCEWLIWFDIGSLCLAVWNNDSRFFSASECKEKHGELP